MLRGPPRNLQKGGELFSADFFFENTSQQEGETMSHIKIRSFKHMPQARPSVAYVMKGAKPFRFN